MLSFIIGFFIGAFSGITLICLVQVAKSGDEIESNVEEIDYTTIYLSGFYNGEDKWKDKIKNRLSELREEKKSQSEVLAKINIEMIANELVRLLEID